MVSLEIKGGVKNDPLLLKKYIMALIKNLHLLTEMKSNDVDLMEYAALQHKRHSNITFKILKVLPKEVTFQITQGKCAADNYQSKKRLVEIVHETFDRFFPGRRILVHPIPYQAPAVNEVTPQWINRKMEETGTRLKDIAAETGLDYPYLSTLINDRNPLSQPMKALFYYYFLSKEMVSSN